MRATLAVVAKELRQIARDPQTLAILLVVPVFFLLLYGYALNFDVRDVPLAVDDRDGSRESRELVSAFIHSGYFDHAGTIADDAEVERVLNRNRARAVLVVPEQFGERVRRGLDATVQVLINGDNANTATTVMGYALSIVPSLGPTYRSRIQVQTGDGPAPPISAAPRVWYNPELRSTLFLVPGLIAFIAMIAAVVSTALSIVREKERGTMEQVRMAPIGTVAFVAGKTVPYFLVSLASALIILLAAVALFDMPIRGSWLLLLLATSLFLTCALGMGLFISTVADSQQVAFQMAVLSSFLPTMILSGFIFPIASMPPVVQAVTYLVPARFYLIALRGIVLKGVGIAAFWDELVALTVFTLVVLGLSALRLARAPA